MVDISRIYGLDINLDDLNETSPKIYFKQYDYQTSYIAFKFYKDGSLVENIGDNYIIGVFRDEEGNIFVDKNGSPLKSYAFEYRGNSSVIILPICKDVINIAGRMACEVIIIDGNGKKITSPRFNFIIYPSLIDYKVEEDIQTETICGTFKSGEKICGSGNAKAINIANYITYEKTVWVDGETIVNQEKLNNMENGIFNISQHLNNLDAEKVKYTTSADESISTIQDALDKLLYVPLTINFSCNRNLVEKGEILNSLSFNWSYNKNIVNQYFENEILDNEIRSCTYEKPVTSNKTFRITASDGKNSVNKTTNITFYNGRYWGTSSSEDYDDNFIKSLNKELNENISKTFNINCEANEHIYYCIPSRLGKPTFTVGGFSGGFYKVNTIDFTNNFDYVESYDIWKSTNNNLGNTTVVVT